VKLYFFSVAQGLRRDGAFQNSQAVEEASGPQQLGNAYDVGHFFFEALLHFPSRS
jgi:hypothetical protein